jgi:hypothetical protein
VRESCGAVSQTKPLQLTRAFIDLRGYLEHPRVVALLAQGKCIFMNLEQSSSLMCFAGPFLPCLIQGGAWALFRTSSPVEFGIVSLLFAFTLLFNFNRVHLVLLEQF